MHCPACASANAAGAVQCASCGQPLPTAAPAHGQGNKEEAAPGKQDTDGGGVAGLIPARNPRALAAYYCGVFSLVPVFGLALAPVAIVLGILGLRYERLNPEAKGGIHALIAIACGSLSLLCNPLATLIAIWMFWF